MFVSGVNQNIVKDIVAIYYDAIQFYQLWENWSNAAEKCIEEQEDMFIASQNKRRENVSNSHLNRTLTQEIWIKISSMVYYLHY